MHETLPAVIAFVATACARPLPPIAAPVPAPDTRRLACAPGRGDCDLDPANGCEVDLSSDPDDCEVCGRSCGAAHTTAGCFEGACRIIACEPGWGDCDHRPENGCEAALCYTSHGFACTSPCPTVSY